MCLHSLNASCFQFFNFQIQFSKFIFSILFHIRLGVKLFDVTKLATTDVMRNVMATLSTDQHLPKGKLLSLYIIITSKLKEISACGELHNFEFGRSVKKCLSSAYENV